MRSLVVLLVVLTACSQTTVAVGANLIGSHDLVFVDQLGSDGAVARVDTSTDPVTLTGMPSRYVFVTSADTNELRVLETFRENLAYRSFLRAPNPLETLSIPVLDRPTMLAADEGRNSDGARVTGPYVYASRPGASEVSVVSVTARRQLGGRPLPVPAPVTAIGAVMEVGADQRVPATTQLYVATWDGADGSVYRATLDTSPAAVEAKIREGSLGFTRVAVTTGAPVAALLIVAPLAERTHAGAAFCATAPCLAIATRSTSTAQGTAFLLDPATGRRAPLGFSGPVRKFAAGLSTTRLYGLLDEAVCGASSCGGVVAVDLVTSTAGFPGAKDVLGRPFGPLRTSDAILTGLAIGQGALVRQTAESDVDGGTSLVYSNQTYAELGAYASSDGFVTFFSGLAGSVIDFNGQRAAITVASVRTPGVLADGGTSLVADDGGVLGTAVSATVETPRVVAETWRVSTVTVPDQEGAVWTLDISDGAFSTQNLVVANQGQIPGLVSIATSASDGARLQTGGLELRVLVGDSVRFETGNDTDGYRECGRATVAMIGGGFIDVDQVPEGCAERVRYTVRAGTQKSLVIAGDVEGYMGRASPGETFHFDRPMVIIPAEVVAPRTSLTMTIPQQVPQGEGAYIAFELQSFINPLRVQVDTSTSTNAKCASSNNYGQLVFGNLSMARVPYSVTGQSELAYRWDTFAMLPSGNGLVDFDNSQTAALGAALSAPAATCYR